MTGYHPDWVSPPDRDALAAVTERARGRARLRTVTLAAGAASLVTAGVVALNLPGPTYSKTVTSNPATGQAARPVVTYAGDDGSSGDDGGSRSNGQQATAPVPAAGKSHTTSGGS